MFKGRLAGRKNEHKGCLQSCLGTAELPLCFGGPLFRASFAFTAPKAALCLPLDSFMLTQEKAPCWQMWPEMGSVSVWEPFRVDPSYLGCSPGVAHLMSVGLFPEPLTKPAFSPQQQNWALPFHAAQTFAPAPAAAKGWHWEVGKVGSCSVLVLCSDEFWTQVDTTPAYGTASSQHKGLSRLLLASFLLTVPQTPCWRALVLNIWKLFSALQSCAALSIICLQISSLSCQGWVTWKTAKVEWAHPTELPQPLLSLFPCTVELCLFFFYALDLMHKILSVCSLMCTQQIIHVHAHKHTPLLRVLCRSRTHPLVFCHMHARWLQLSTSPLGICSARFSSGPEALVLQLCHIVYMIKCSICSYISWANSDKCYQSSYLSEWTDHWLGTEISPCRSSPQRKSCMLHVGFYAAYAQTKAANGPLLPPGRLQCCNAGLHQHKHIDKHRNTQISVTSPLLQPLLFISVATESICSCQ